MSEFRQNLDVVNTLLQRPGVTAEGAYAMGLVSALAERDGIVAPAWLLEAAVFCRSVAEASELYGAFAEGRRATV